MANHLEDQEPAVVPAAATEGQPTETTPAGKAKDENGNQQALPETAPAETAVAVLPDEKAPPSGLKARVKRGLRTVLVRSRRSVPVPLRLNRQQLPT